MKNVMKKSIVLLVILCITINTFAAIVSDNDGSAFITKAEFDSLKNNFQSEINSYNTQIDQKIDDAVASYLSGIKVSRTDILELDEKSKYLFPLVMCGPNNEWNDFDSNYFDLSIPFCDNYDIKTTADRSNSDDGVQDSNVTNLAYTNLPTSVSRQTTTQRNLGNTCRISHEVQAYQYAGRVGTMNTLRRTTGTREINGTNKTIFEALNRGRGRYNAYKRSSSGINVFWDGNAEGNTDGKWNYMSFIGLNVSNFGPSTEASSDPLTWAVASGDVPTIMDWTRSGGMVGCHFCNGNRNFIINLDGVTNVEAALTVMNNAPIVYYSQKHSNARIFQNPFLVLPDWEHTNGTNTCYYGTANMQANIDGGYWKFSPVVGTSAATQRIDTTINQVDWDASKFLGYNFTGSNISSYCGVLPYRPTMIPYWQAANNNSFLEQSSDDFSQLRASLVYYLDSNNEPHFLDEGMYLGTYDKDNAEVTFIVKFKDDSSSSVDLALSKKPFGYDAIDSDKVSYKYKIVDSTGTENICTAGSSARISCNNSYKITVGEINKGDKLYMQWQPSNAGHYVALESFTDYSITGN